MEESIAALRLPMVLLLRTVHLEAAMKKELKNCSYLELMELQCVIPPVESALLALSLY